MNFEAVARVYSENQVVAHVIDLLATRQREPKNSETRVKHILREVPPNLGAGVEEIQDALELIAQEAGDRRIEFKKGRPLEESRIEWDCSAIEFAKHVLDQIRQPFQSPECEKRPDSVDEEQVEFEVFTFPVRRGVDMPLRIRADLTAQELLNLAEFVQVLARSRGAQAS
ncbi:MAG: hypothetical protein B6A08_03285 [Sorangiineae bacterium NIC37A_2]|jgi:hypothetical protein|nr:MAG: hypothetical protein B6A08_03285 [Sorangiineae bacterium NIC37A_2]